MYIFKFALDYLLEINHFKVNLFKHTDKKKGHLIYADANHITFVLKSCNG